MLSRSEGHVSSDGNLSDDRLSEYDADGTPIIEDVPDLGDCLLSTSDAAYD